MQCAVVQFSATAQPAIFVHLRSCRKHCSFLHTCRDLTDRGELRGGGRGEGMENESGMRREGVRLREVEGGK